MDMQKKIITLCFVFIGVGCSNKISPKEEIALQVPLAPIMIGYDSKIYSKALEQEPTDLTKIIYDSAVSKGFLFKRILFDSGRNDQFENDIEVKQINSLCVMSKFILSEKYKKDANLQGEVYKDFYEWLKIKQIKWEKIVLEKNSRIFDVPCGSLK